jgi:hypothetical protein
MGWDGYQGDEIKTTVTKRGRKLKREKEKKKHMNQKPLVTALDEHRNRNEARPGELPVCGRERSV